MQRIGEHCPVCNRPSQPPKLCGDDGDRIEYWHADLVDGEAYCVLFADGSAERVRDGAISLQP